MKICISVHISHALFILCVYWHCIQKILALHPLKIILRVKCVLIWALKCQISPFEASVLTNIHYENSFLFKIITQRIQHIFSNTILKMTEMLAFFALESWMNNMVVGGVACLVKYYFNTVRKGQFEKNATVFSNIGIAHLLFIHKRCSNLLAQLKCC